MAKKFIVTYTDGREPDEVAMTMRAMCKAEEVMAREGMNATNESINATARALHCALRFTGKTKQTYADWLESVDDIEPAGTNADPAADPLA